MYYNFEIPQWYFDTFNREFLDNRGMYTFKDGTTKVMWVELCRRIVLWYTGRNKWSLTGEQLGGIHSHVLSGLGDVLFYFSSLLNNELQ